MNQIRRSDIRSQGRLFWTHIADLCSVQEVDFFMGVTVNGLCPSVLPLVDFYLSRESHHASLIKSTPS